MPRYLKTSELRLREMERLLDVILSMLVEVLTSETNPDEKICILKSKLKHFFNNTIDVNFQWKQRISILNKFLTSLVTIPLKSLVPYETTIKIYNELDIVNTVTFLIFQMRQIRFSGRLITEFLEYIKNASEYGYFALLLYRVNPNLIEKTLALDIDNASPKELYFGISTGFFRYREGDSESYKRLVKLIENYDGSDDDKLIYDNNGILESYAVYTPGAVLTMLYKDGFISKYNFNNLRQHICKNKEYDDSMEKECANSET